MSDPKSLAEAMRIYESLRPTYVLFVDSLRALLSQLLGAAGIDYVAIEGRAKTIDSFKEKAQREGKNYQDPSHDITDLAGIRIIAYHVRDLDAIASLLREDFDIDDVHSIDKTESLEPDRFGYLSRHYVVTLNEPRRNLRENGAFRDLCAEIQVRTVLQHAWAAIDHKLRYKTSSDIPRPFRRRLFRVSALLEAADDEFAALRSEMDALRDSYVQQVRKGNLQLEVDADSVAAYVTASPSVRHLRQTASESGYTVMRRNPDQKVPEFTELVKLLFAAGVSHIDVFEELLANFNESARVRLNELVVEWRKSRRVTKNAKLVVTPDSLLRLAVLLALPTETSSILARDQPFGPVLKSALTALLSRDSAA